MSEAPPCHKLCFQFGGQLLEFFSSSKQVSGLRKPSFLQYGQVLGICLYSVVPLVLLPEFCPNLLVKFVTSAASLAFVATKAFLLVVSAAIEAVRCSSTTFSIVGCTCKCTRS